RSVARSGLVGAPNAPIRVRFVDNESGGLVALELETDAGNEDRAVLCRALRGHRVRVLQSELRASQGRCVERLQLVEADGSAISRARRAMIQFAVMAVVERLVAASPPPARSASGTFERLHPRKV